MLRAALILAAAIAMAFPAGGKADPLDDAIERFSAVESYRVTIRSTHAAGEEYMRYYYRKPGYVRMEFFRPHRGAVIVYRPDTGRARVWPFGAESPLRLTLNPSNAIIRSMSGMRVDQSDVGALFKNIRALRDQGSLEVLGEENVAGHVLLHLVATGAAGVSVAGVHSSELWLDEKTLFPAKVVSRDMHGAVIETVVLEMPEINVPLPQALFAP